MTQRILIVDDEKNIRRTLGMILRAEGFAVTDAATIGERLGSLLHDDEAREKAGGRARAYVKSQLGATEKCMAALCEYL